MGFIWSNVSLARQEGLQPPLIKILTRLAEILPPPMTCNIAQACRTAEEEMELYLFSRKPPYRERGDENGKLWKTNCNGYPPGVVAPNGVMGTGVSNHQGGYAVDLAIIVNNKYVQDVAQYRILDKYMQQAAADVNERIGYGGDWPKPKTDSDHWYIDAARNTGV